MGELIPFNLPYVPEISKQYVLEALDSKHQQGDGPFTAKASSMVSDLVGGGHVLLTPSCTHALEMASMLANIGPGDEVILPSYTFTSAATALTKFGATPIFVDIDMDTKGIDVNQVRESISPRTKAISWVNYAGVAPDVDGLQSLAKEFNLLLIEDNAHGLGGTYKGRRLGSFGDFATQSFHATKNIQCGEGGALVVNNPIYVARAEVIREKGTDRSKFMRGEVQKYQWVDQGSSYLLAESLSAILLGQLELYDSIHKRRLEIHQLYQSKLSSWVREKGLEMMPVRDKDFHTAHLFYLVAKDSNFRDLLIEKMRKSGVTIPFHYQSLSDSTFAKKMNYKMNANSHSLRTANGIFRLPVFYELSHEMQDQVISSLIEA